MIEQKPPTPEMTTAGRFRLAGPGVEALKRGLIALAVACLAFGALGVRQHGASHFMLAYLTAFIFYLTLSLGGLFFVMLHHLTGARWSVVLRRLAETLAILFPLLLVLFLPILGWLPQLYAWANPEIMAGDAVLRQKALWLNVPFFIVRSIFYFAVWTALAAALYRRSLQQDQTGDPELVVSMRRLSAPGMPLFAVTLTFAAFDWVMSLDAHWYSTIFGVYLFAGAAVAIYAVLVPIALALGGEGRLRSAVSVEHFHDLGKLLFAFVIFWAYIAFSQMMLIWVGNIPEETIWLARRWNPPAWRALSIVLIAGHFVLPMLFLLPRTVKRSRPLLAGAALWMLGMHYADLSWLILPTHGQGGMPLHATDLALFAGMGCLYGVVYLIVLQRQPLVPLGDPRLADSIAFENT